ncbi:hypothetical protein CP532_0849 [Ophiocordyceps camponoti-leonardi (nom. inval.)]|nr:hypothetical protein CP532_0849 [Ophiocordyceps camponoti-leonardi (nom. inval.)]
MKPFPLGLAIGTDICQISRVGRILAGPRRGRFLGRILTAGEREAAEARMRLRPGGTGCREEASFVAGRFAAKEAVIKAFSSRAKLGWHDIEVERGGGGGEGTGPVGRVRRGECEGGEGEDEEVLLSISHDGDYATAFCVASIR